VRIIGFHGTAAPNNSKASPVSLRDGKDYEITPANVAVSKENVTEK
jgi:hypothetical protein